MITPTQKLTQMNKIFIILGPSGAGKGSITSALAGDNKLNLVWSKTATTRPPRDDDKSSSRHKLLSEKEFMDLVKSGEILEHNRYNGNLYGTLQSPIVEIFKQEKNPLMEIDINGAMNLKKIFPDKVVTIFIYATREELKKRLLARGMDDSVINQRLKIADEEYEKSKECDYRVHNKQNELPNTINNIKQIITTELEA